MSENGNPRWLQYCRVNGRTEEEQLADDRKRWPGGPMVGYTQWNDRMISRFCADHRDAFCLSGRGLALTTEGHARYDAWLAPKVETELTYRQDRMHRDAAKIRNVDGWPRDVLPMKTQYWVTEAAGGRMRLAKIHAHDLLTVEDENGSETYASIEDLVRVWSVD
ncbi:hypothetical protein [uncultured Bosea sp.]|uniref:hypothetical protein n=1 Tax=uncultured Bosea sp. TaxID=211457 RepID=UPI0025F5554D|nr:hypothetical protein [uncultured Bosea sp.]